MMENNNNNNTDKLPAFPELKHKKLTKLKNAKCCISGCPSMTNLFFHFPQKYTRGYDTWLKACEESHANITFKKNPTICALHFRNNIPRPTKYLTKKDLETLKDDLDRVNHCVAEWVLHARKHAPDIQIEDDDVYIKAIEIGKVYQLPHFEFDVDFGWLNIFESYLHTRGIEIWSRPLNKYQIDDDIEYDDEEFQSDEESATKGEEIVEEPINSYEEAVKRVEILQSYCKRTNNKRALEIIQRLNKVLQKRV